MREDTYIYLFSFWNFLFFFTNYKYNFNFFLWCASIALVYTYRDYKLTCRLQQTICRECVCHYTAIREAELKTSICAVEWGKDNVGHCLSIWQTAGTLKIGKFWVAFHLCFKASPSAKPFIWKLVLFTCKWTKMCVWIKLIYIWKASHWDSFWHRGGRQLGNCL